jgi:hypothetical protein
VIAAGARNVGNGNDGTAAPDPRRSYDRGVWAGAPDNSSTSDGGTPGDDGTGDGTDESAGARPGLAGVPTTLLVREIERRRQRLQAAHVRREKLLAQIAALDAEIRDLDDEERPRVRDLTAAKAKAAPAIPRQRQAGSISLGDALAAAVKTGQVVSPADAARLVMARGYRTTSRSFGADVSRALARHGGFRREGRGQYVRVAR